MSSSKPAAAPRVMLATTLIMLCVPAMSESFLDKLKKAKDSIERGTDEAKRTLDDVAELGSTGQGNNKGNKKKSGGSGNGDDESGSTTVRTTNGGDTKLSASASDELRQQVGRMGTACRERSAEHENFASCHTTCSEAQQKISGSAKDAANNEAHASCLSRYNQAMGIGGAAAPEPAKVESGQSPMPGAG